MKVTINSNRKKSETCSTHEMEEGKVYDFSGCLAQQLPSGCFIVHDTNDDSTVTFDDHYDLDEWLGDNGYTKHGTPTPLVMKLVIE